MHQIILVGLLQDFLWLIHLFAEVQYWQNIPVKPLLHVFLSFITDSTSQWDVFHVHNSMMWVIHVFFRFVTALVSFRKSCHHCFPSCIFTFFFFFNVEPCTCLCWILYFLFSYYFFSLLRSFWVLTLSSWILSVPLKSIFIWTLMLIIYLFFYNLSTWSKVKKVNNPIKNRLMEPHLIVSHSDNVSLVAAYKVT